VGQSSSGPDMAKRHRNRWYKIGMHIFQEKQIKYVLSCPNKCKNPIKGNQEACGMIETLINQQASNKWSK
jgi:hypothetical protein